ncbi:MAG: hypothetical protein V3U96_09785 [Paracoccaceae bacterium]
MPLNRLVLILTSVIAAAGITVWVATTFAGSPQTGGIWALAPVVTLGCFLAWRYIVSRQK